MSSAVAILSKDVQSLHNMQSDRVRSFAEDVTESFGQTLFVVDIMCVVETV